MKITQNDLASLIAEPYLSRGYAYFQEGVVELTSIKSDVVKSQAIGTRVYKVTLKRKGNTIDGNCTCPAFEDFGPCKHMAATGFALMKHYENGYKPSNEYFERSEFYSSIERALMKQTKEDLISLILRFANDYPEILEEFEVEQ